MLGNRDKINQRVIVLEVLGTQWQRWAIWQILTLVQCGLKWEGQRWH